MFLEGAKLWITVVGSLVAAVAAAWNLYLNIRGTRDILKVGVGPLLASARPEYLVYVLNRCDHVVRLSDYGFINQDFEHVSIPMELDVGFLIPDEVVRQGSSVIEPGGFFESGFVVDDNMIGVYAMTVAMKYPRISFNYDVHFKTRFHYKLKLLRNRYVHTWKRTV